MDTTKTQQNIPSGWKFGELGNFLTDIGDGGTPSRLKAEYFGGEIPWVVVNDIQPHIRKTKDTLTDVGLKRSSAKLWPIGSVILSFGATIGEVGIADVPVTTKQGIAGIIPSDDLINSYLYYLLLSKKHLLHKLSSGSTIKEVRPSVIKKQIEVLVPPIKEQQKIAEILGTVDEDIAKIQEVIEATEKLKRGLMHELLTGQIINSTWESKRLEEVATISRGGSPRPIESYLTDDSDGLNWLRIGDIDVADKYIYRTTDKIKREGLKKTTQVQIGDLILSNSMSFGRPYIMKIDACIHDGWLAFKNISKEIKTEYLYYILSSDKTQSTFYSLAMGSGVKNLKRESVSSIEIKFPEIDEQNKILAILSSVDEKISINKKLKEKLILFKKGLMQDLLSGNKRVKI